MKSLAFAAALSALLISPVVQADSCQGDVTPLSCGVVPQTGWNPFPPVIVVADDLRTQQEANEEWRREQHRHLVRQGYESGHVCNGEHVPVEVAAWCWNGAVGGAKQPNPAPQIGSGHGSD